MKTSSPVDMRDSFETTIYAECASKANSRRLVKIAGKPRSIKSAKAIKLQADIAAQVSPLPELMKGDLCVWVKIYYPSRRPDLDASAVYDGLQGIVYKNDRQIKRKVEIWALDPRTPRIIVVVQPLEGCDSTGDPGYILRN